MAAPTHSLATEIGLKPRRTFPVRRPEELFSRDGPLGARADVRVITSDGQILWLHRVVLEMWSSFFHDLIAASEEHMDACAASTSTQPAVATITLTDTAADLMLLLSCLYPASHHSERPLGSSLDPPSFLPLLGLADKYQCPHIIHRCASFATDHLLPRLADCTTTEDAAEVLQLPGNNADGFDDGSMAAALVEWIVRCLEAAVRLHLDELVEDTTALLGRHFFTWGLQAGDQRELLTRVARVLSPEHMATRLLASIPAPPPPAPCSQEGMMKPKSNKINTAVRVNRARAAVGGPLAIAPGAGAHAGGGGGGPRIVPVVVAAAGPAAAVAAPPLLAAHPPPPPPPPPHQPNGQAQVPQPFQQPPQQPPHHPFQDILQHLQHHQQQHHPPLAGGFWHQDAGGAPGFAVGLGGPGVAAGGPLHPEPLLGPGN